MSQECGVDFTAKLEGMFSDMELSSEVMKHYKSYTSLPQPRSHSSAIGNSANIVIGSGKVETQIEV